MISYSVEVDVAARPEEAVGVVRRFMEESMPHVRFGGPVQRAGTARLIKGHGPAGGNPLVGCRFRARQHAREFVELWYNDRSPEFVESQIKELRTGPSEE